MFRFTLTLRKEVLLTLTSHRLSILRCSFSRKACNIVIFSFFIEIFNRTDTVSFAKDLTVIGLILIKHKSDDPGKVMIRYVKLVRDKFSRIKAERDDEEEKYFPKVGVI